jgi:membrane-bound lytic murein transglycosylase B
VDVHAAPPPAQVIVRKLRADERELRAALVRWDGRGPAPADVSAAAADRQRLIRSTTGATATEVMRLAPSERDDLLARRDLRRLAARTPPLRSRIRVGRAPPASRLLAGYRQGERRFGVHWQLLAAVNFVESSFGKVRNTSVAGAQGPMQFEPATWRAFGLGGNVHDPHDAILGAANYLAANGARTDERAALYHYNPSPLYVDAVLHYAHRIANVREAFLEYLAWAVYVRTPTGYRRVSATP